MVFCLHRPLMARFTRSKSRVFLFTTRGMDGAAAGAVALRRHPDAELRVVGQNVIDEKQLDLLEQEPRPTHLHLCGVGVAPERQAATLAALKRLRDHGITVEWHIGFATPWREKLAAMPRDERPCTLYCPDGTRSTTEAVVRGFGLDDAAHVRALIELGRLFREHFDNAIAHATQPQADWFSLLDQAQQRYECAGEHDIRST